MTEPVFKLQIVDMEGFVARFHGGGEMERDLVEAVSEAAGKKIGLLTTRRAAKRAIWEAFSEVVNDLKQETMRADHGEGKRWLLR